MSLCGFCKKTETHAQRTDTHKWIGQTCFVFIISCFALNCGCVLWRSFWPHACCWSCTSMGSVLCTVWLLLQMVSSRPQMWARKSIHKSLKKIVSAILCHIMLTGGQNYIQLVQWITWIISSPWNDRLGNLGCGCLALTTTKNCCKIKLSLQPNGNSTGMPNYKKCTGATRGPWLKAWAVDAIATDPNVIEPLCWIKQIGGGSSHSTVS